MIRIWIYWIWIQSTARGKKKHRKTLQFNRSLPGGFYIFFKGICVHCHLKWRKKDQPATISVSSCSAASCLVCPQLCKQHDQIKYYFLSWTFRLEENLLALAGENQKNAEKSGLRRPTVVIRIPICSFGFPSSVFRSVSIFMDPDSVPKLFAPKLSTIIFKNSLPDIPFLK